MTTMTRTSAECTVCQRDIRLRTDGTYYLHGPRAAPCIAVYCTPDEADRLILPPLNDDQMAMMREAYRTGDWRPIEIQFGIRCPQYALSGTHEEALAEMVEDARRWITALVRLSQENR